MRTGCQALHTGCQPLSQAYQSAFKVTDFIPSQHTPEGQAALPWIPSCFQAELQWIDVKGQWTAPSWSATEHIGTGEGDWVIPHSQKGHLAPEWLPTVPQDTVVCLWLLTGEDESLESPFTGGTAGLRKSREHVPTSAVCGLPWWLRQQRICLQCRRPGFDPWARKIPWRREWQPTPVFLPRNSMDRGAWGTAVHGLQRINHDWETNTVTRYQPPRQIPKARCKAHKLPAGLWECKTGQGKDTELINQSQRKGLYE